MRRLRPLEKLNDKDAQSIPKIFESIFKCKNDLKKLYSCRNVHFSTKDKEKMKKIDEDFQNNRKTNLSELTEVIAPYNILKDVARGVYFYNLGHLTEGKKPEGKIDLLSEYFIRKVSSALTIQRIWKGYCLRKRMKESLSQ